MSRHVKSRKLVGTHITLTGAWKYSNSATVVQSYKEVADAINTAWAHQRPMVEFAMYDHGDPTPTVIMLMVNQITDFHPNIVREWEYDD